MEKYPSPPQSQLVGAYQKSKSFPADETDNIWMSMHY